MQQQRVLERAEVRHRVVEEAGVLRMHAPALVVRHVHRRGGVPPGGDLLVVDAERRCLVGVPRGEVGGVAEVPLGHHVRVDVVVDDRRVLVRAGHAVDVEDAGRVVVAERAPEPRGLDQQLQACAAGERLVARGAQVAQHRIGDVGVDVERRRPRGPVRRALLPVDRSPREGGARQPELRRALPREVERRVAPAQRVGCSVRRGVRERGEDEGLRVPEDVPVVAGPGQALGGDRPPLGSRAGLQRVEEAEADRLLQLAVAVDLDVRPVPEVVQVLALARHQPVPARVPRRRERGVDLVAHRRQRALARPAVGEELRDRQAPVRRQLGS